MGIGRLGGTVAEELAVADSIFPHMMPFSFRNVEINEYFEHVQNFCAYTIYPIFDIGSQVDRRLKVLGQFADLNFTNG